MILFLGMVISCKNELRYEVMSINDYEANEQKIFDTAILLQDKNYDENIKNIVLPFLDECRSDGYVKTRNDSSIYYEHFLLPNNKGTVVIFQGFCEFTKKFDEVTYYFLKSDYSVLRFDHRGQGLSYRDYNDNASKVFIKNFSIYTEDAFDVIQEICHKQQKEQKTLFLFAHSMGGCIGADFIEKYPQIFKKAVLSCPMLRANTGVPEIFAFLGSSFFNLFGFQNNIVMSFKEFSDILDFDPNFSYDGKTARTASFDKIKYQFSLRLQNAKYQTTAATYGWTAAAIKKCHEVTKRKNIKKANLPILVFRSENDTYVRSNGIQKFCDKNPNAHLVFYPDVEHKIYNSKSKYLPSYYEKILEFYEL